LKNGKIMMSFNYRKTLEYLYQQLPVFHRDGSQAFIASLSNINALSDRLGHPHKKFKSVHIAGTNGKGSVSHMIASVMQEAGFKTGLYTSPHINDFRERIRINGQSIPEKYVTDFLIRNKNFVDALNPSFFELTTAMAFDYFANEKVDVAIIETGLGGRLDSTNIIRPLVSVITNISNDHMDILGNNLMDVAREKAGIIKHKIPVVIGQTQPDLKHIFEVKAEMNKASIFFADENIQLTRCEFAEDFSHLEVDAQEYHRPVFENLVSDLAGEYQKKNIITAIKALILIKERLPFDNSAVYKGLANVKRNTGLKGRWQIIGKDPLIIADAAHNPDGIASVVSQVKKIRYHALHIIFGVAKDKSVDEILGLLPKNAIYYFTKAQIPRAVNEEELSGIASVAGLKGKHYKDVNAALAAAKKNSQNNDMILITGSMYILGELDELKEK